MNLKKNNTFFQRNSYLLVIAAWCLTIAFIINNYWSGTSTPFAVQKEIQKNIDEGQKSILSFFQDTALIESIVNKEYNEAQLDLLKEKKYFVFFYRITAFNEPEPFFWNTQNVEPDLAKFNSGDIPGFVKLLNGWYAVREKAFQESDGSLYKIIALLPVKWDYYIQNKYLFNSFVAMNGIEKSYDITLNPTPFKIKNDDGSAMFYLAHTNTNTQSHDNIIALWLRILAAILVLFFIHTFSNYVVREKGFRMGFLVLLGSLLLLRLISYNFPFPLDFKQLELFGPFVYGSNFILRSLGDLLINSLLFIWVVLFIRYHFRFDFSEVKFKMP